MKKLIVIAAMAAFCSMALAEEGTAPAAGTNEGGQKTEMKKETTTMAKDKTGHGKMTMKKKTTTHSKKANTDTPAGEAPTGDAGTTHD